MSTKQIEIDYSTPNVVTFRDIYNEIVNLINDTPDDKELGERIRRIFTQ